MAEITQKLVDGAGLQTAMGIMGNYSDNMDRGVVGGYNQSFPLTAATKGNIYYHKPTNRYYICINNYSGSSLTNPNSNFEELSVYTNRQRLDNLSSLFGYEIFSNDADQNTLTDFIIKAMLKYHFAILDIQGFQKNLIVDCARLSREDIKSKTLGHIIILRAWNAQQTITISPIELTSPNGNQIESIKIIGSGGYAILTNQTGSRRMACFGSSQL